MLAINSIPIWLDCDPGHDDAVAILLASLLPSFKLLGISASYGNAPVECTTYNALSIITALGKCDQIPVYKGAEQPWVRTPVYAKDIHGDGGLDGTTLLPKPGIGLRSEHYLDAMEDAILRYKDEITIVCTGPMTAAANLFKDRPHLKECVKYLCIMGGSFNTGNRNPNKSAEYNVWIDPHAASFVFHDKTLKSKSILIPLDLTHRAIATREFQLKVLGNHEVNVRKLFYELFVYFAATYKNIQGFDNGPPVHDPLTLLPLLQLYGLNSYELIQYQYEIKNIEVELEPNADEGKVTMLDADQDGSGIMIGVNLNFDIFWKLILDALILAQNTSTIEAFNK